MWKIYLVQMKKKGFYEIWHSTSSWKSWGWFGLSLIFKIAIIYTNSNLDPLTKFSSNCRSTSIKNILPWSASQTIANTIQICTGIVIAVWWKGASLFWVLSKVNRNQYRQSMIRIFQMSEWHCCAIKPALYKTFTCL